MNGAPKISGDDVTLGQAITTTRATRFTPPSGVNLTPREAVAWLEYDSWARANSDRPHELPDFFKTERFAKLEAAENTYYVAKRKMEGRWVPPRKTASLKPRPVDVGAVDPQLALAHPPEPGEAFTNDADGALGDEQAFQEVLRIMRRVLPDVRGRVLAGVVAFLGVG